MFTPTPISIETMEENGRRAKSHDQHLTRSAPRKSRTKFGILAGAAALALTMSACSNTTDSASGTDGQPANTATTQPGELQTGATSEDETQSVVASRPTTSLVDVPLEEEETALELEDLPEIAEPQLTEREDVVADVAPEVEKLAPEQEPLEALNEVAKRTATTAPPADAKRDGYTRNDAGQLMILDNDAALACADVEIGLTALDAGDIAAANAHISSASTRAGSSQNNSIASWSDSLSTASGLKEDSVSVLVGFIAVCAEGGYEI